jgi:hypothetical protein
VSPFLYHPPLTSHDSSEISTCKPILGSYGDKTTRKTIQSSQSNLAKHPNNWRISRTNPATDRSIGGSVRGVRTNPMSNGSVITQEFSRTRKHSWTPSVTQDFSFRSLNGASPTPSSSRPAGCPLSPEPSPSMHRYDPSTRPHRVAPQPQPAPARPDGRAAQKGDEDARPLALPHGTATTAAPH